MNGFGSHPPPNADQRYLRGEQLQSDRGFQSGPIRQVVSRSHWAIADLIVILQKHHEHESRQSALGVPRGFCDVLGSAPPPAAGEVNDVTPGGVRALLEKMRRVMSEEAAFGAEVLVHHFETINPRPGGASISALRSSGAPYDDRRIGQHAVIAPIQIAGKGADRHVFDISINGVIGALRGSNWRLASVADGRDDCADGTISTALVNARGTPDEIDRSGADAIDRLTPIASSVRHTRRARRRTVAPESRMINNSNFSAPRRHRRLRGVRHRSKYCADRADGGSCPEFDRRRKLALNADPIAHIRLVHAITPQAFDQN